MTDCPTENAIAAYLDGAPSRMVAAVSEHLAECAGCRAFVDAPLGIAVAAVITALVVSSRTTHAPGKAPALAASAASASPLSGQESTAAPERAEGAAFGVDVPPATTAAHHEPRPARVHVEPSRLSRPKDPLGYQ